MYKKKKPMLTSSELIQHLEDKGVKFELISKEDAERYLRDNNNYYKLASYRKNYPKYEFGDNAGKYIGLDFKMLMDLSVIDLVLRKTLLSMILDLEHYTKVKLLVKVENTTKDGYKIVEEYINFLKENGEYNYLENELNKNIKSTYCGDIVSKYMDEFPIWAFIEVIPFGRLIKFYKFVADELGDKEMLDEAYLLKHVRELRNACAHNNCILNDMKARTSNYKANYGLKNELSKIGISKDVRNKRMSNTRIQQIVTMLYLNKRIISSEGVYKHQVKELEVLAKRIMHHIDYYDSNLLVKSSLLFLYKCIDKWYLVEL